MQAPAAPAGAETAMPVSSNVLTPIAAVMVLVRVFMADSSHPVGGVACVGGAGMSMMSPCRFEGRKLLVSEEETT